MGSESCIGNTFIELQQVESTNNYATRLAHEGMAQHGAAVFTHHQTNGKGQRSKTWYSQPGKNIALSVIVHPNITLAQSFLMSMAVAVGVHRFFKNHAGDETKIKWPNDIYWRDRKAAGILIENIIQGAEWKWCVIGIGINVNQTKFEDLDIKAASLKQITGKEFEPIALAKDLCTYLDRAFKDMQQSRDEMVDAYKNALFKLNEKVLLKKGSRIFPALIKEVTSTGYLVVQTSMEESFEVGEIEWII